MTCTNVSTSPRASCAGVIWFAVDDVVRPATSTFFANDRNRGRVAFTVQSGETRDE